MVAFKVDRTLDSSHDGAMGSVVGALESVRVVWDGMW